MTQGHPLMEDALKEREEELMQQIAQIPLGAKEAKTVLCFSGGPVQGSMGIDAGFASRVLDPFQAMVAADYAERWHGGVGRRGRRPGETKSKLLLSGLPRGSFGFELTRADDDLFPEDNLADTLAHVARLIESSVKSDADFAAEVANSTPRAIQCLKGFLDVISKSRAGLRIETGDIRYEMSPVQAEEAFNRVANASTIDEEIQVRGVFKGVLLDSWNFDFVTDEGYSIKGKVDDGISEEQLADLGRKFLNSSCLITLLKTVVTFRNGDTRTAFIMKGLEGIKHT